jgi:hypothetical protein
MNTKTHQLCTAIADINGMAVTGRTLHSLRGLRFLEGEGTGSPAAGDPADAGTPQEGDKANDPAEGAGTHEGDPNGAPEGGDTGTEFDADKARDKIRRINSENKNLRTRAAEAEAKAKESEGKDVRMTALEAENLRLRIGVKHGLPESLVKRLSGSTEEELLQDAEELMGLLGGNKPPTNQPRENLRGGGDPTREQEKAFNSDEFARSIFAH